MNQYEPRPGSTGGKALAVLRANGITSHHSLASQIDVDSSELQALLAYPVKMGVLREVLIGGVPHWEVGDGVPIVQAEPPLAPPAPLPSEPAQIFPPAIDLPHAKERRVREASDLCEKPGRVDEYPVPAFAESIAAPAEPPKASAPKSRGSFDRERAAAKQRAANASATLTASEMTLEDMKARPFRAGIFSDEMVTLRKGAYTLELDGIEARQLHRMLDKHFASEAT